MVTFMFMFKTAIWWFLALTHSFFFLSSSAFFVFCSDHRPRIKEENPGISIGDIAKKLGELWATQSSKDKAPYEAKAAKLKEKYEKVSTLYPALQMLQKGPNQWLTELATSPDTVNADMGTNMWLKMVFDKSAVLFSNICYIATTVLP